MQKSRKPLVYWCRWNGAALRLAGRDDDAVWGELAYEDGVREPFRFDLNNWALTRQTDAGDTTVQLDEMGVPR